MKGGEQNMHRQNYRYLNTYLMLHHEYHYKQGQKLTGNKGGRQTRHAHYETKKDKID